jgi:NodT family efflux transporter outer membrane factor (OMF) lipoprotein
MKQPFLIAATAVVCSLAGCAAPSQPPGAAAAAPPQWYGPLPHDGSIARLNEWWRQWDDPLLAELIEAAQSASPTVSAARSQIEQARAARIATGAALLPTLDASASAARGNSQPPVPLLSSVQGGLQTAWEIDLFGGNRAAAEAAQARLEGAEAGWHEARVAVAAETATSYVSLRTCERQREVADQDARSRAESSRLAQLSAAAGFTAPGDAALARATAAEAAVRATQQRAQCDIETKALVALSTVPEPRLRERLRSAWVEPPAAAPAVPAVPAQLLAQRPDVYRAEREVAAASADVGSAQAQRYPRLTLSGSIAAGTIRSGGFSSDLQTWSIGPLALTMPLFDGGRRAAEVDAARARYHDAAAQYAARVRQGVREVEEALVALESARLRSADSRTALEGYQASLVATEARYRGGLASLVELEVSRRAALGAETALVTLERERLTAWVALYRALGGGWRQAPPALAAAGAPS